MSTPTPPDHRPPVAPPIEPAPPINDRPLNDPPPPRRSAALWVLLALLALLLVGWFWLGQRDQTTPVDLTDPDAPLVIDEPVVTDPAPVRPDTRPAPDDADDVAAPARPRTSPAVPIIGTRITPEYPVEALRLGESGTVVLRVSVGADGTPGDIGYASRSGSRALDAAARDAVNQWRFEPALRDGEPIASVVEIPIDFDPPD